MLFSVLQVGGCFDYPLTQFIINITSEDDSWYHPVYKNSSLASGDIITLSIVLKLNLLPDSAFSTTVSTSNEIGTGMPSDEVKFCELFWLRIDIIRLFLKTSRY